MPILTSTALLCVPKPLCAKTLVCQNPGSRKNLKSWKLPLARHRPAADAAPGQPGDQLLRLVLGDGPVVAEPVPRADLGHADQRHAQQLRLVLAQARILVDGLADDVRAGV